MRAIQMVDQILPCNWKVMLENIMDFYHVAAVHSKTVNKHIEMVPDFKSYGDHSRPTTRHRGLQVARAPGPRVLSWQSPTPNSRPPASASTSSSPTTSASLYLTVMQPFPLSADSYRLRYAFFRRKGTRVSSWPVCWGPGSLPLHPQRGHRHHYALARIVSTVESPSSTSAEEVPAPTSTA